MIAIIGAGKMGEALLSGLLRAGRQPAEVLVTERSPERAALLEQRYGVSAVSNAEAARKASTVLLAVKPQDMGALLDEIAPILTADQLVVTIAAGITDGLHRATRGRRRAGRPGDVQHPGLRRRGDERDLGRVARHRGSPRADRGPAAARSAR